MEENDLKITEYLCKHYGFKRLRDASRVCQLRNTDDVQFDLDKFTCVLRVHQVHYLFFSEALRHFTVAVKYDEPKGLAGGGYQEWNRVMWPRVIYTELDCDRVMAAII